MIISSLCAGRAVISHHKVHPSVAGRVGRCDSSNGIRRSEHVETAPVNCGPGRDHHPRCFTMWMAGAGVKPGFSFGETDDFSYNIVKDPVHVHDFQATLMHLMGIDHERLVYKFQGRRFRLTDVHGKVVNEILA